jgi:hypothetical protein
MPGERRSSHAGPGLAGTGGVPEEAVGVELVETHISYLFFTDHNVYQGKEACGLRLTAVDPISWKSG